MASGMTMRVERTEIIRQLGAVIRDKQRQFEKDKLTYPKSIQAAKAAVAKRLQIALKEVRNGITVERLKRLMAEDVMDWTERRDLMVEKPELNLCREQAYLEMFQKDVRKVIPINSNSDLWSILKPKCEVIHG